MGLCGRELALWLQKIGTSGTKKALFEQHMGLCGSKMTLWLPKCVLFATKKALL